jgi:amidophosphoribosyltransferase
MNLNNNFPENLDKLKEECGVFGIKKTLAPGTPAGSDPSFCRDPVFDVYNALYALQHRGQESCGIAACNQTGQLIHHKNQGLVPEVFTRKELQRMAGATAAIGHVRHANGVRDTDPHNAQPIVAHHASGSIALCYNGKLVNSRALKTEMENRGAIFQTTNDAEVITNLIVREHLRTNTLEDAVLNAMEYLIGAYSMVIMDREKLIAARDPNGIRPLCVGRVGDSYVFSSESCAIHSLGGEVIRDINPGEVAVVYNGELNFYQCAVRHAKSALCMFELIYFARQDSIIDGASVGAFRNEAGRCLAQHSKTEADLVIGVPDSGIVAAMGYSAESGIPYGMGLMKNRYIQRTFIQSRKFQRQKSIRIKLNAMSAVVKDKRIILVDDSIVRGNTMARIVQLLRDAGAKEVHVKITAPPFIHTCYYGTAIPPEEQLAAHGRSTEEICALIGADSLQYMPLDGLKLLSEKLHLHYCDACFTGNYALPVPKTRPESPDSVNTSEEEIER